MKSIYNARELNPPLTPTTAQHTDTMPPPRPPPHAVPTTAQSPQPSSPVVCLSYMLLDSCTLLHNQPLQVPTEFEFRLSGSWRVHAQLANPSTPSRPTRRSLKLFLHGSILSHARPLAPLVREYPQHVKLWWRRKHIINSAAFPSDQICVDSRDVSRATPVVIRVPT